MTTRVVLPAYNEAKSLKSLLPELIKSLKGQEKKSHIYVVDDGSTDNTAGQVRKISSSKPRRRRGKLTLIRHERNLGLSEAINSGLRRALKDSENDDIIVTMDADNSHLPGLINRMVRLIEEGNDVVISSRFTAGARVKGVPLGRRILSRVASFLFRFLFPIRGVKDYTCGYRAYRVSLLKKAMAKYGKSFIDQKGFSCMVDILLKLREFDPIITEVPMILRYDLKPGKSKMNVGKTIGETAALMLKRFSNWDLILILGLSFIFRFYNFKELQYWGGDEEVLTATIRHIVWDRSPTLLVQSASLGFGLGPFYHYFLSIFYWIFDFRLVGLQAIGSILGVVTTLLVYLSGKEISGRKLGFVAGVLYASSFFLSLVDRRVVHLTLNPVLAALTCFVLIKAVKQKFRFLPLLALPIGFAFHEDASLLVLVIAIILSWIFLKIPLLKKKTILIGGLLFIFFLPFAAAEVRYNGAVVKPFIQSVLRPIQGKLHVPINYQRYIPFEYFRVLARALFLRPSEMAEEYLAYSLSFKPAYFSPALEIAIFVFFATGLIWLIKNKVNNNRGGVIVLWIIQASFIFGIIVFNLVFKEIFYAHYFTVFFPVFILLFSHGLLVVFRRAPKLLFVFLCVYILLNFHTLLTSRVKYPLYRKIQLVEKTLEVIDGREFSVYASDNPYVHGGGWTELYTLAKHPAVKSYWYDFWGWIYAAYSLFPTAIQKEEPAVAVWFGTEKESSPIGTYLLSSMEYKDLIVNVYDNSYEAEF